MKQYFPEIPAIKFEGVESKNPLAYRYYDKDRVVMGKKMSEWFKFAMAWWHTLCAPGGDQFGGGTKDFPWKGATDLVQAAKDKADAGFEIMQKLGIEYYCFHDIDLVDEADTVEEYEKNLKEIVAYLKQKQDMGADYAVTQLFYDNRKYFDFVKRARAMGITIPIVPGIKPFAKCSQITMVPKTFHCDMPQELAAEAVKCKTDDDARALVIEWTVNQCRELFAAGVKDIHFYTVSAVDSVVEVAQQLM